MKLLWIHIQDDDCSGIVEELKQSGYRATLISSTEDLLNYGETTLFLGVDDDRYEDVITRIKAYYKADSNAAKRNRSVSVYVLRALDSCIANT